MAAVNLLGSVADSTTGISAVTGSVSPSANALVLCGIIAHPAGGPAFPASVSGAGLTWTLVDEQSHDVNNGTIMSLYRADAGASPGSGAVTVSFAGGQDQIEILVSVVEVTGVDPVGTVVQTAKTSGNSAVALATLAAFGKSDNVTYGLVAAGGLGFPLTPGAGFTQAHALQGAQTGDNCLTEYRLDADTTVDAALNAADPWGVIACEIKTAAATVQTLLPDATVSAGAWTPVGAATLHGAVDEVVASDTDYAVTAVADDMRLAFSAAAPSVPTDPHRLSYRIDSSSSDAMTVSLMMGSTTIASWAHDPAPAVPTTFVQTLTAPQAAAITNYGNLAALFSPAAAGGAAGRPTALVRPNTLAGPLTPSGQITATQDQLIQGMQITTTVGPGIIVPPGVTGVRVWACEIGPCGTSDPNDPAGVGVLIEAGASADVAGCVLHDVASGVYSLNGSNPILVEYNYAYNIRGPKPRGQMVQFNGVQGGTVGSRVRFNLSDAKVGIRFGVDHGGGLVLPDHGIEDHISMHDHTGVVGQRTEIAWNHLRGGHNLSTTGSGMILGDGQNPGGNQWSHHNTVVEVKNTGIGVAGGDNIDVEDNRIYLSGTADFSGATSDTHTGMYSINFAVPTTLTCGNHNFRRNRVWAVHNGLAGHNEFFDSTDCSPVTQTDNVMPDATLSEAIFDDGN